MEIESKQKKRISKRAKSVGSKEAVGDTYPDLKEDVGGTHVGGTHSKSKDLRHSKSMQEDMSATIINKAGEVETHLQLEEEERNVSLKKTDSVIVSIDEPSSTSQFLVVGTTKVELKKRDSGKKSFDYKGGVLQLPESQIELTVPRGALHSQKEITVSSFFCASKLDGNLTSVEAIEVLPHQTFFSQKVVIFQPLEHLRHTCYKTTLRLFYNSGSEEDQSNTEMGILELSQDSLNFKNIEVQLRDDGILIHATSFCRISIISSCESASNSLSLYCRQHSVNKFCILATICCNCKTNREQIKFEKDDNGYAFQDCWNFTWKPCSSLSDLEIVFSCPKDVHADADSSITFSKDDLLCGLKKNDFSFLNYNCYFTVNDRPASSEETIPPSITANCIYREKTFSIFEIVWSILSRIFNFSDGAITFERKNTPINIKLEAKPQSGLPTSQTQPIGSVTMTDINVVDDLQSSLHRQPSDADLNNLSKLILGKWAFVGRTLQIPDDSIEQIKSGQSDVREQAYQMLKAWKERNPAATVEKLCVALDQEGLKSAACEVFKIQDDGFPK
ncbi:uncharacterized protein [Oscarella lobularis]|uniref:uncharacterized protein isoform X2 n=1 Tax=Oscarella lobularis TaxID=121494 RepID=UPI003313F09E